MMNTELSEPLRKLISVANEIYLGSNPSPNSYVGEVPAEFQQLVYKATSNLLSRVPGADLAEAEGKLTQIIVYMRDFLLKELYTFQYMPSVDILAYEQALTKAFE